MLLQASSTRLSIFVVALAATCTAIVSDDYCAYTFNIPASDCSVAPVVDDQLEFLETIVLNQQSHLQLLTDRNLELTDRISSLEASIVSNGEGNEDDDEIDALTDRIVSLEASLVSLEASVDSLEEDIEEIDTDEIDVGSTYIRWGRTTCPSTAQRVYEGQAGKSYYTHGGGGVDYQCLPNDPEFPSNRVSNFQSHAYIYGVEYETNSDLWSSSVNNGDVPCAVCSVTGRSRQLMIPAMLSCPSGWVTEYSGLLATQYYSHQGATYICVDSQMETLSGGSANNNGGLLYVVEAKCGSLKCPPYQNGYEIACSVCTR